MKTRKKRKSRLIEKPQEYEHRTECALAALDHGMSGCLMLVKFLLAEQGSKWPDIECLDTAFSDWRRARKWLKKIRQRQRGT